MRVALLSAAVLLSGCSSERTPDASPTPTATVAAPRTLIAADFDPATLGARVPGMESTDTEIGGGTARVSAFVACPKAMTACDPRTAPEGTIYTYVLTVTPDAAAREPTTAPAAPGATETAVAPVEAPAELVRTTRAAPGFNAAAGFSRTEAAAALGADDALTVTLDQNQLIWRVTGGTPWAAGKPVTLWWQSTSPPAKPAAAYRLEYAGKHADITAPFPAADKAVEPAAPR